MKPPRTGRWISLASAAVLGVHAAVGWGLKLALDRPAGDMLQRGVLQVALIDDHDRAGTRVWAEAGSAAAPLVLLPLLAETAPHRVLSSDEVDESARPQSAWTLAAHDLAELGLTLIEFEAWVSESGTLGALRVLRVEPDSAISLAPLLEQKLLQTAMWAARKSGVAVPQRLVVELGLSSN